MSVSNLLKISLQKVINEKIYLGSLMETEACNDFSCPPQTGRSLFSASLQQPCAYLTSLHLPSFLCLVLFFWNLPSSALFYFYSCPLTEHNYTQVGLTYKSSMSPFPPPKSLMMVTLLITINIGPIITGQ